MTKSLQIRAAEITPATIGTSILEFQKKCARHAETQIALTNEARAIGVLLQAWCGHEQMSFEFWQRHKGELPKQVSFAMLKTFVSIAHRLPDNVDKLAAARRVWQQTFESVGLLEIPERTETQKAGSVPRYTELVNRLGIVRGVLAEWNRDEPFETWNDETRAAVAGQLRPLAELYHALTAAEGGTAKESIALK
jgi:hypothetical protein